MPVPPKYVGREQTYLKHRVLEEYLVPWGARYRTLGRFQRIRIWYVDCFAGPWRQAGEELDDTSACIGLNALEAAGEVWRNRGYQVDLAAIFVEKNRRSFKVLDSYLKSRGGPVEAHALRGEFGGHVAAINQMIGADPAFLFVDPTGWKGAAMKYIAPLAAVPKRTVLVTLMFNHLNRFKNDRREFLVQQMRDFFALRKGELPSTLGEAHLLRQYRGRLKETCHFKYAADLAVPHPKHDRTWFRLVLGCHDAQDLALFRTVEREVIGAKAEGVRLAAQRRQNKQLRMFAAEPDLDDRYCRQQESDLASAKDEVLRVVGERKKVRFGECWPRLLEDHHISLPDLRLGVGQMHRSGKLVVQGMRAIERHAQDHHFVLAASKVLTQPVPDSAGRTAGATARD